MKYAAYDEYKPSGIEWLGNVPSHWKIARSDGIVASERRQVQPEAFLSEDVFHYSIPLVQEYGTGAVEEGESIKSAKQPVFRKSLLVSKLNPRKATIVVAEPQPNLRTVCSTEFVALFADKCDLGFLTYVTLSEAFRQRLDAAAQSVTRSHQRANPRDIYSFWNAWPLLDEQQTIARFLDAKTAQIDALVAQKRQLIDKLKEKRQALIARTVTRGLPPEAAKAAGLESNPEMKDSGVDWLGFVPKAWEVIPLKWRARCSSGDGIATDDVESNETTGSSIPVIGGNGLMGYAASSNIDHRVLVIGRVGALCGNVHIVNPPAWITDNALVLRPKAGVFDSRYLAHVLRFRNLNDIAVKTAQPLITGTQVRDQRIPCPPMPEQTAMADFLDAECLKLDVLTCATETAIARLTEYRQALITSAVTGKIDVRELA